MSLCQRIQDKTRQQGEPGKDRPRLSRGIMTMKKQRQDELKRLQPTLERAASLDVC